MANGDTTLSIQDAFAANLPEVGVLCGEFGCCREAPRFDFDGRRDSSEESGNRLVDMEGL